MPLGKHPTQASGVGTKRRLSDAVGEIASRPKEDQAGESGGGAYPNPHTGKEGGKHPLNSFMGHGGQSEQAYHGPQQLGDDALDDQPNAGSRDS